MNSGRRQQILDTAADLFANRGFHGVSVHDIGHSLGVSGPALYRYFANKDAILDEMLIDISERLLAEGQQRVADCDDPSDAVDSLLSWHIEFALTYPALIVVQEREWSNLSAASRDRVRALQLRYIDLWVDALRRSRPELDVRVARAAVQAVFGLINSTPHSARISKQGMRALLTEMASAALRTQVDATG